MLSFIGKYKISFNVFFFRLHPAANCRQHNPRGFVAYLRLRKTMSRTALCIHGLVNAVKTISEK